MGEYAKNTSVSTERSRAEVETILARYGASGFAYRWAEKEGQRKEMIEFVADERHVRFLLPMPSQAEERFKFTPSRRKVRSPQERHKAWEQACRQRWRALALAVKAKLEAVESGISIFEQEFLSFIVNPATNKTVGEEISPALENVYNNIKQGPLTLTYLDGHADSEIEHEQKTH